MSQGVAFFNLFRDLVASGFWTSRLGTDDVGYTTTPQSAGTVSYR